MYYYCTKRLQMELKLKENPVLSDFQDYVKQLEEERGFSKQNAVEKCLLLGEEIGELFKAIRKSANLKTDVNAKVSAIDEELADIFIYLCSIANRYNIDLEKAFREKEEINKTRVWK